MERNEKILSQNQLEKDFHVQMLPDYLIVIDFLPAE